MGRDRSRAGSDAFHAPSLTVRPLVGLIRLSGVDLDGDAVTVKSELLERSTKGAIKERLSGFNGGSQVVPAKNCGQAFDASWTVLPGE